MLKASIPDPTNPSSFTFDPDVADKVYFVFCPINNREDLAFLCSIITVRDNNKFLRFEPRYFDKIEMLQFVNTVGLKEEYQSIMEKIAKAKTITEVIDYILSNENKYKVDVRDVRNFIKEGYSPLDYSDYTTSRLFCYEPRGI
jgi:hypothetical protein